MLLQVLVHFIVVLLRGRQIPVQPDCVVEVQEALDDGVVSSLGLAVTAFLFACAVDEDRCLPREVWRRVPLR